MLSNDIEIIIMGNSIGAKDMAESIQAVYIKNVQVLEMMFLQYRVYSKLQKEMLGINYYAI